MPTLEIAPAPAPAPLVLDWTEQPDSEIPGAILMAASLRDRYMFTVTQEPEGTWSIVIYDHDLPVGLDYAQADPLKGMQRAEAMGRYLRILPETGAVGVSSTGALPRLRKYEKLPGRPSRHTRGSWKN